MVFQIIIELSELGGRTTVPSVRVERQTGLPAGDGERRQIWAFFSAELQARLSEALRDAFAREESDGGESSATADMRDGSVGDGGAQL